MIGIVVIGKNEGRRLVRSLAALLPLQKPIIYVDSLSDDGSVPLAKRMGVDVIVLDQTQRCTSALGRNLGFNAILEQFPQTELIQFVDGDCELDPNWLQEGEKIFKAKPHVAIVAGILEEKDHHANMYKTLSGLEWEREVGEIDYCGGNLMMRVDVFRQIGGFNPDIVAGEDNDLCHRAREKGWKVFHLDKKMAVHDSKISTFSHFWCRSMRTGYAYAQVSWDYWNKSKHMFRHELYSTLFWGGAVPIAALLLSYPTGGWSLLLFAAYLLLFAKIYRQVKPRWGRRNALMYSYACTLGKFPAFLGACKFYLGW